MRSWPGFSLEEPGRFISTHGLISRANTLTTSRHLEGLWLILLLFAGPGSLYAQESKAKPKLYDGRTLDEWRRAINEIRPENPASQSAVPGLLGILNDKDAPWFTRRQVANTLGRFGKNAPEGVPVLIELLDEPRTKEHNPRIWAAKALALYGPLAREATPRLVEILKDRELPLEERAVALEALGQIGGAHPRAIPSVVELLSDLSASPGVSDQNDSDALRELAAECIGIIGKDAAVAVPVLMRSINDPSESMRRKTIAALGRIGPASQLAIPSLLESLAYDEFAAVRDAAETALAAIGSPAVPALVHLLQDQDAELRLRAARGLGQMKILAQPAANPLRKLLVDKNPEVRLAVAKALWQITNRANESLPVFVETLKSPDRQLRMQAFRVLTTELGPQAAPARVDLMLLSDHPESYVRQAARKALERIPLAP